MNVIKDLLTYVLGGGGGYLIARIVKGRGCQYVFDHTVLYRFLEALP